jgi:hypothetical protein
VWAGHAEKVVFVLLLVGCNYIITIAVKLNKCLQWRALGQEFSVHHDELALQRNVRAPTIFLSNHQHLVQIVKCCHAKIACANVRYKKLLVAWKKARPTPKTPEEAARFVVQTLKNHQKADVEVPQLPNCIRCPKLRW